MEDFADDAARAAGPAPRRAAVPSAAVALTGAATALAAVWLLAMWAGWRPPTPLAWAGTAPPAWLAAGYCWRVAGGATARPARRFWRLSAVAIALIGAGALLNLRDVLAHASPTAAPTATDTVLVYLSGVVVMMANLLLLPGRSRLTAAQRRRFLIDAAIVVVTVGVFAWRLSFSNAAAWRDIGGGPAVFAVVVLAFLAVFTFIKLALVGVSVVDRGALHRLSGAVAAGAGLGALSPILAAHTQIDSAAVTIPPVALGFVLAARRQGAAGPPLPPARPRRPFSYLPYVAVAALDTLLLWEARSLDGERALLVAVAVLLTGLVVYRQVSALTDNARLLRQVDAANRELDATVRQLDTTVRDLRDAQEQLSHQADHDALTGLANRRRFGRRMDRALARGGAGSVVLIDLDDFKSINDRLGHGVGDALLVVVGERLQRCVRPGDTVARLGGDEFAILLATASPEAAGSVLDRIGAAFALPVRVGGHDLLVRCSTGIAPLVEGIDATEAMRRADLAMYAAKEAGKGRTSTYHSALDERANQDAQLGAELRLALDRGDFRLLFQPVVRLPDGVAVGAEALVRWHHPQRGVVPPDEFIPAAERTGLIVPLGAWVLREACRTAAGWLGEDAAAEWTVSVNVSARQLRERGFADVVSAALREAGLPASRLMIEVTETALFDSRTATATLHAVAALGVTIALDDFGTGQSSLGLLRNVPVDVLKVDKTFIDHITDSPAEAAIATAVVSLAKGLDLGVVAEGVESAAQARQLHCMGYQLSQGYHFARPLPAAEVQAMLAAAGAAGRLAA